MYHIIYISTRYTLFGTLFNVHHFLLDRNNLTNPNIIVARDQS